VCVCNLSPEVQSGYRVGFPSPCRWVELLNTDSTYYGGTDVGNLGGVDAESHAWHDQPFSAEITLPPLAVVWFVPE
jgi:1,4-alpha-glucan branching enzyme